jgi:catechol 2,3-dioxygenase-like lactoylglutathione lyase family enzyme
VIDHVSVQVRNIESSAVFYDSLLKPLGIHRLVNRDATVGFGKNYPEFWINLRIDAVPSAEGTGAHICLRAKSREAVIAFHDAALVGGGRSDGKPGTRRAEITEYFGAFILDLDGNKIEAVTFPR